MKEIIKPAYSNWEDDLFYHYVKAFDLPLNKKIKSFSKGIMMKASLAIALSHHAMLIIVDEPPSRLHPNVRRELLDILHDLMHEGEMTVFISTHVRTEL